MLYKLYNNINIIFNSHYLLTWNSALRSLAIIKRVNHDWLLLASYTTWAKYFLSGDELLSRDSLLSTTTT